VEQAIIQAEFNELHPLSRLLKLVLRV